MKVLGIDAALHRSGLAWLDNGNLIATAIIRAEGKSRCEQLGSIFIPAWVHISRWQPDVIAIESSAKWQRRGHDKTAVIVALSEARAAFLIAAYRAMVEWGCNVVELDVHHVRDLLCKNRQASKEQVQECLRQLGYELPTMVERKRIGGHIVEITSVDPDAADGLALAYIGWCEARLEERVKA